MTATVTIELTEKQAGVIMQALELYSRLKMGQFETITDSFFMDTFDKELKRPVFDQDMARAYLMQSRAVIFTDLQHGAYIGISHTGESSKISWDIYQQLRHDLCVYTNPKPSIDQRGRSYDKPHALSKQPLPRVVITDEE